MEPNYDLWSEEAASSSSDSNINELKIRLFSSVNPTNLSSNKARLQKKCLVWRVIFASLMLIFKDELKLYFEDKIASSSFFNF